LSVTAEQLVGALEGWHGAVKLRGCGGLRAGVAACIGTPRIGVAQPGKDTHAVRVQGKYRPGPAEQVNAVGAGLADAGIGAPGSASYCEFGAPAQPTGSLRRPRADDDALKHVVRRGEDLPGLESDHSSELSERPPAPLVIDQVANVLREDKFPAIRRRHSVGLATRIFQPV
jgi:hypothetical protein